MNPNDLYPYLLPGPPDPAWAEVALPIGHGVYAVLFEDHAADAGIVHATMTPDQLRAAGLTAADAHRLALDNLARFADEDDGISIQMLGGVGDPVHFLLYSDHPRAAACLRLPDLYAHSRELLKADALCACVPQRESLVIFPDQGQAYRDLIVGKLRAIDADAERPISLGVFDLSAAGLTPRGDNPVSG